jgi:ribosome-binding protein aMBF1 (putative translation factor)
MKCDLCKKEIEEIFLGKLKGTHIKIDGKKKVVCDECQGKHKDKLIEQF